MYVAARYVGAISSAASTSLISRWNGPPQPSSCSIGCSRSHATSPSPDGSAGRSHSAAIWPRARPARNGLGATTPTNPSSRTTVTPGSAAAAAVSTRWSVAPGTGGRSARGRGASWGRTGRTGSGERRSRSRGRSRDRRAARPTAWPHHRARRRRRRRSSPPGADPSRSWRDTMGGSCVISLLGNRDYPRRRIKQQA